jgi:hypothetical protein
MSLAAARHARARKPAGTAFLGAGTAMGRARLSWIPLPVAALLLAILLPPELDFAVGSVRLNCARVVLLVFLPVAVSRLLSGRLTKLRSYDYFFIGYLAWYALAVLLKEPLERAAQTGGIIFLEATSAYLLARAFVRDVRQFLSIVKTLFIAALVVGAFAIPESLLSSHIVRNTIGSLVGLPPITWVEVRAGLARAMSVFDHPIHYGAFCATVLALVWFVETNPVTRALRAALITIAAIFSFSAGPLQGIAVVFVGAIWEYTTRQLRNRVWLSIVAFATLYMLASLFTNRSPLKILVTTLVFDSASYYYRMLIWDIGIANVMKSPVIGMPMGFWERPAWMPTDSVDNYWLTIALWGGLPSLILLVLAIITLLRAANRYVQAPESAEARGCRYGWNAAILAMCVMGASVHWWGSLAILFAFYLGMGGCLADLRSGQQIGLPANRGPFVVRRRRGGSGRKATPATGAQAGGERAANNPDRSMTT